jgi:multimeric flavodoxin WrbA
MEKSKMKVMIINGSPRKGGYTSDLVSLFQKGVEEAGGETHVIYLRKKKIAPCIGCFKCWVGENEGQCIFSDDMDAIIEEYLETDTLVLATPMYYYSFSSFLKVFLERLFPTCRPGLDKGGVLGLGRNRPRFPDKGPKRCALIATCALRNPATMKPLVGTFELVCDAIAAAPAGKLLRPESNLLDFRQAKPRTFRRVVAAVEAAGGELVRNGAISPNTEAEAMLPFSNDEETFAAHFVNYWTIAGEIGPGWIDRETLFQAATTDPRIIMRELAGYLNPKAAGRLKAVVQLILNDSDHGEWYLTIDKGHCRAVPGVHESPNLVMKMSQQSFADIALQRTNARTLFNKGLIEYEGDANLLANFGRLFPKPNG